MKPGTLSALNQRLCVPLKAEPALVGPRPGRPTFPCQAAVSRRGTVLPVVTSKGPVGERRVSAFRRAMKRFWKRAVLLALIAAVNLCALAFERVDRARERHLLGREIAEREQRAHRLVEISRHVAGVMRVQQAQLLRTPSLRVEGIAQGNRAPRGPLSGG